MSSNPLIAAYRKPAMYVSLPSKGKFYDPKPNMSVDGELAVYPMTARDELIIKTPDALFNGEATTALIKSCCPDIENPHQVPVSDLIVLLLAIRASSYGKDLDVDVQCPSCNELNMLSVDSSLLLATAKPVTDNTSVELNNGFTVDIKPYNIKDRTLLQIQQVKQQRLISALVNDTTMDDEMKNEQFGKTFVEIAELTIDLVSNCIVSVAPPEQPAVTEKDMIKEWLQSISNNDYEKIKEKVEELGNSGINNKLKARCQSCGHTWETGVELDMANFFAG